MLRRLAAVFLALHGIVHVMGFAAQWRLSESPDVPYRTTVINGAVEVGDLGALLMGLAWVMPIPLFLVAAYGAWSARPWALAATAVAATISLVVCVLGLPSANMGLAIDVVILGIVAALAFLPPERLGRFGPPDRAAAADRPR